MAKCDRLIPVAVAASACLCLGGCTLVPIRDSNGKVTGVGPNWVAVEEGVPSVLDQAEDAGNRILDVATSPAVLGLSSLFFGGSTAYAARAAQARRERELYERERERERQAWDEAKLEELRLRNSTTETPA